METFAHIPLILEEDLPERPVAEKPEGKIRR
jgi:hypothetical protein